MTAVEYTPPLGDSIVFRSGRDVPFRLIAMDGIGPVATSPVLRKSPGQIGSTAVDVIVPARVVVLQTILQAASLAALWPLRSAFSRALVTEPVISGELNLGRLRITDRPGSPDLELLCLPRSASLPAPRSNVGILPADVEFLAPQPWWQSLYDSQLWYAADAAGLEWPTDFPIEFLSNNVEQEATNEGDVQAPITARIYGELTSPRLSNLTTGEAIEVTGVVAAGDYLEVSTEFGDKRVELVTAAGVRSNAMDRLNLSIADFWRLLPGANLVRFEAAVNTSGRALLLWRSRYSGI